ncbi:MAG TPA: TSUP family transporter [Anaerolineales bacterium]|nr:TSUP family transporter [Anaerolineales bacterium]
MAGLSEAELLALALLCLAAFAAGFVDSIAGGGGLIQLPALMLVLPGYPLAMLFGTNKIASIFGTGTAVIKYSSKLSLPWKVMLPTAGAALIGSGTGALVASSIPNETMRPIALLLLVAASGYILWKRDLGSVEKPEPPFRDQLVIGILSGLVIGFYDGVFGPGTGSFLIFVFVSFLGLSFLRATASAKIINFATNFAAILVFLKGGNVLFQYALPMAFFNMAGGFTGSHMAMLRGNKFVNNFFLFSVGLVVVKLIWDMVSSF